MGQCLLCPCFSGFAIKLVVDALRSELRHFDCITHFAANFSLERRSWRPIYTAAADICRRWGKLALSCVRRAVCYVTLRRSLLIHLHVALLCRESFAASRGLAACQQRQRNYQRSSLNSSSSASHFTDRQVLAAVCMPPVGCRIHLCCFMQTWVRWLLVEKISLVFFCDIMDPASCLHSLLPHLDRRLSPQGLDPLKSFLKFILARSATAPSYSMVWTITSIKSKS